MKAILPPNAPLGFGKYHEHTPELILSHSPAYLNWILEKTDYSFPKEFIVKIHKEMDAIGIQKANRAIDNAVQNMRASRQSRQSRYTNYSGDIDDISYEGRGYYSADTAN